MRSLITQEITSKIMKAAMGLIHADIELINASELDMAKRHIIGEEEIKRVHVRMLVHTGALHMCINELVKEQLGLTILAKRRGQLADGRVTEYDIAGPIQVRFKNRRFITEAIVLPADNELLLGAIALEGMDVLIDPTRQELVVHPDHPDCAVGSLKKAG